MMHGYKQYAKEIVEEPFALWRMQMSHKARYDQSRTHKVWGHGFIPSPTYHVVVANTSGMVTCYYGLLLYLHKEHMSWHDHGNNSYVVSFPKPSQYNSKNHGFKNRTGERTGKESGSRTSGPTGVEPMVEPMTS